MNSAAILVAAGSSSRMGFDKLTAPLEGRPLIEWSLRAEPAWSDPVAWVHRRMLADFDFRDPSRLAPELGQ